MRRLNDGTVYTNEKCVACNRCVSSCPVLGANVFTTRNGISRMMVAAEQCIHCGRCVSVCLHDAREYQDDLPDFLASLANGERISLLVAPSLFQAYGDEGMQMLGFLQSLGVGAVYDNCFGAEISFWAHVKYLEAHGDDPKGAFIGQYCYAFKNLIEQYDPEVMDRLIPVHSPSICSAIYIRKYLKDATTLAFLSPCIAETDEIHDKSTMGVIKYHITFKHLFAYFADRDLSSYRAVIEPQGFGFGQLLQFAGGSRELIGLMFPRHKFSIGYSELNENFFARLKQMVRHPDMKPFYLEVKSCRDGCISGPAHAAEQMDLGESLRNFKKYRENGLLDRLEKHDCEENRRMLEGWFGELDRNDFTCSFTSRYQQTSRVPENTYDEIFTAMHKDTEQKRHLDCGSCGYSSCREMVRAIALGYNKMESCIHYLNDEIVLRYYRDELTGLPNKEGFVREAKEILRNTESKNYVLGMAAINQLNVINDLCGFEVGDRIIRHGAQIVKDFVGLTGTVGRYSGSKYLLLFELDETHEKKLEHIRTYDFSSMGIAFPVSYKAGLCRVQDAHDTVEHLINLAMLTMDKIPDSMESAILIYDGILKERLERESQVTTEMFRALENNEFVAYYQPQYNHRSGEMVGAEMLCRWRKADGTLITPDLFIPVFEKNGFIYTLDQYMWEHAFMTIRKWLDAKIRPVPIAVNISRLSVVQNDFVQMIERLKLKYEIPPKYLHFEITESAYTEAQEEVIRGVNSIRAMGFQIAMDDFGRGYSSLNALKDVPIDILKLDLGFLRGGNAECGDSIIENVIRMVRSLRLEMIAEGVETQAQADTLLRQGCEVVQGFYYARPIPQAEFEERLAARKP